MRTFQRFLASSKRYTLASLFIALVAACSLNIALAQAEQTSVINIKLGQQGGEQVVKPARGNSQAQVISSFGQPLSKQGPTGQPPIEVWRYAEFAVYFEGNYVIHSVAVHKPQSTNNHSSKH